MVNVLIILYIDLFILKYIKGFFLNNNTIYIGIIFLFYIIFLFLANFII